MRTKITAFFRRDEGGIIVIAALLLPVFLGFTGLSVDVGLWYQNKRHLQLLADSLAVGGALALKNGSNVSSYVAHDAQLNNFAATNGRTLTVNIPPTSGSYAGNTKAVEVILTSPSNRYFTASFLPNAFSISVRAVALLSGTINSVIGNSCLTVMDKTNADALYLEGTAQAIFEQCGIYVNSSSSRAVRLEGSSKINTTGLSIVGNYIVRGGSMINSTGGISTGVAPIPDPYAGIIPIPSFSGCNFNNFQANGTMTINPGVYCNGLTLDGVDDVTMNPGLYIIDRGSFSIGNSGKIRGNGVTIFLTSSTGSNYARFFTSGAGIVNLTAPSSGTYANVVAFSPPQASGVTHQVTAGSSLKLTGLAYFPTSNIEFSGGTSTNDCIRLVVNKATFTGSAILTGTCVGGTGSSVTITLVE